MNVELDKYPDHKRYLGKIFKAPPEKVQRFRAAKKALLIHRNAGKPIAQEFADALSDLIAPFDNSDYDSESDQELETQ